MNLPAFVYKEPPQGSFKWIAGSTGCSTYNAESLSANNQTAACSVAEGVMMLLTVDDALVTDKYLAA